MSSRTWPLAKDTSLSTGVFDGGNGNEQHAPIGLWSGYVFRYLAQYAVDTSGMASISSATLHIRATTQVHVAFGSSPTVLCQRLIASWVGSGGSEGVWSSSANPKGSTPPAATSTGESTTNMTETENAWDTIDVTAHARAWLAGSPNYGLRFRANSEASGADTWEAYAQASLYDSYITVVFDPITVANPPNATPVKPLTGDIVDMSFPAGFGYGSPRTTLYWSFSDPDSGQAQSAYQVRIYNDSGGVPGSLFHDTGKLPGAVHQLEPGVTFVEGAFYHWQVMVWDSTDLPSAWSDEQRFQTRWGMAEYIIDLGATPAAWSLAVLETTGTVAVEYNSTTDTADPGAGLGTWEADLALVTKRRYLRYRVWLLPNNAITPSLDSISFNYNVSANPDPDGWTLNGDIEIDRATLVYGTQSLRSFDGGWAYQLVSVVPNKVYQFSAHFKQEAFGSGAYAALVDAPGGTPLAQLNASPSELDWGLVFGEWNSGTRNQVYVQVGTDANGLTAWFDALFLEAATVPTAWKPAQVSASVTVDAQGMKVDAELGGVFRLKGSGGGSRDTVELGTSGLIFGGDTELLSPSAGLLTVDGVPIGGFGSAFPSSPSSDDRFYRTDLAMEFFWTGSRWLSTDQYDLDIPVSPSFGASWPFAATATAGMRAAIPALKGGSDIWLVDAVTRFFVNSGGTALGASHKWVATISKADSANSLTTIATVTIDSGASATWRSDGESINALLGANFEFQVTWTKTGTPGTLVPHIVITYRVVAT